MVASGAGVTEASVQIYDVAAMGSRVFGLARVEFIVSANTADS